MWAGLVAVGMKVKWCVAGLLSVIIARLLADVVCIMTRSDKNWCSWSKSSDSKLQKVEEKILRNLKTPYTGKFVDIGSVVGQNNKIWTIVFNENLTSSNPLVMIHGLGSGVALWVANYDEIVAGRTVYALDFLGFGRSSRPEYSDDVEEVEKQMVAVFEAWRKAMGLEKFIILGHSLGGFISTLYAFHYPQRIHHLILADPWGISEKPSDVGSHYNLNFLGRGVLAALAPFNPLWPVRVFGPIAESLIRTVRRDIVRKLEPTVENANDLIPQYLYQCNSRDPSGEGAFHTLMHQFAFAKEPLILRFDKLDKAIPMTILFGSHSWVDKGCLDTIEKKRFGSYLNVHIMTGCGHHINLDQPSIFNRHVYEACLYTDRLITKDLNMNKI